MKKNRIVVFDKAVSKHLEDLSYFEDLIVKHYLKFSYGYNIIATDEIIELVEDIECDLKDKSIKFILTFSKKIENDTLDLLNVRSLGVHYSDRFVAEIESKAKKVILHIKKIKDTDPDEYDPSLIEEDPLPISE